MPNALPAVRQTIENSLKGDPASSVECGACGLSSDDVGSDRVIEHVLYDHIGREDIIFVRRALAVSGQELALLAGLPTLTEAEEKWRTHHAAQLLEPPPGE